MKYNSANMNTLIKSCLTLCLLWSAIGSHAQVIKKSDTDDSKKTNNQLSVRAQSLYDTQDASDADIPWMRVIYRQIDLNKEKNMPLYYPEESTENQENLFRIVMKLLANNQIPAYEYLDGREIFTDEYRIKVKEMFDRFHILYAPAKGYSEKNPRFTVEESDIPSNEVLSYYILEKWIFDRRTSQVKPSIEAICRCFTVRATSEEKQSNTPCSGLNTTIYDPTSHANTSWRATKTTYSNTTTTITSKCECTKGKSTKPKTCGTSRSCKCIPMTPFGNKHKTA